MNADLPPTTTPAFDGVRADTAERRQFAQERLHAYIKAGASRAAGVVSRIMTEIPQDQLVSAKALRFEPTALGLRWSVGDAEPKVLHRNAGNQMASRLGIPVKYLDLLDAKSEDGWKQRLLSHTLHEHFAHDPSRYLMRSVQGVTKGFLSDRYQRIDSRPVVSTLVETATKLGAIVVDGVASDTRSSLKVIMPKIVEPFPGEFVVWGLAWSNSDFGNGANQLSMFIGRVWCWNGMVGEKTLRQIHLGRQLDDRILFSQNTLELSSRAAASAAQDAVKHCLSEARMAGFIEAIKSANDKPVNGKAAEATLARRTTKALAKTVVETFNSADVVDLPAGNTDWRWANALSLVARNSDNADQKIDLEVLAGEVLAKHGLTA